MMDKQLRRYQSNGGEWGYFHGIYQRSDVVVPSYAKGGHSGGPVARPVAVVELMDGTLRMVEIEDVRLFVPQPSDHFGGAGGSQ